MTKKQEKKMSMMGRKKKRDKDPKKKGFRMVGKVKKKYRMRPLMGGGGKIQPQCEWS